MGQIKVEKNVGGINGLCIIETAVHGDNRGYFMETYNQNDMNEAGLDMVFVQDNQSCSVKGVLRGLHFQKQFPQGKLVRVIKGSVFDVAVDLRSDSETYGKWFGVELTEENKKQFYIPEGFAHGFLVLSDIAEFCYKCTDSTTPVMRADLHGMTLKLTLNGRSLLENTAEVLILRDICFPMAQSSTLVIKIKNGLALKLLLSSERGVNCFE